MGRFSRILPLRRQGKNEVEDGNWNRRWTKDGPPLQNSSDFHQLNSRRLHGLGPGTRKATRTGKSRIIATAAALPSGNSASSLADEFDEKASIEQICSFCSDIDFAKLLNWQPGQSRPWIPLSHALSDCSSCPYCTFFLAMIGNESVPSSPTPESSDKKDTGTYTPYFRTRQAFEKMGIPRDHELGKAVLFEVSTKGKALPRGFIIRASDDDTAMAGYASCSDDAITNGSASAGSSQKTSLDASRAILGRMITPLLDPALVKGWMDFCDAEPDVDGQEPKPPPGLKLFDCEKGEVVTVDKTISDGLKYITLSYVRDEHESIEKDTEEDIKKKKEEAAANENNINGQEEPASSEESEETKTKETSLAHELSHDTPLSEKPLFKDAIHLTRLLGYRYLWVDALCQGAHDSTTDRAKQLESIADIFTSSSLTVISTGCNGTQSGIPGVSVSREEQLSIHTTDGVFTTTLLRPDLEIGATKWASQAWTLQEGIFAKRQLVLTSSQAYFQCGKMHCHESVITPLRLSSSMATGRVFPTDTMFTVEDFRSLAAAFITRHGYQPRMRLDGFKSILKAFTKTERPIDNLLGLPLFHPNDFNNVKIVSQTDRLATGLGWTTAGSHATSKELAKATADMRPFTDVDTSNNCYHLDPDLPYPSWTWLPWSTRADPSSFHSSRSKHGFVFNLVHGKETPAIKGVTAPPNMEISVGFEDGMLVSWEIDGEAIAQRNARIQFLHMTTYCFDVRLLRNQEGSLFLEESAVSALGHVNAQMVLSFALNAFEDDKALCDITLTGVLISGRHWRRDAPDPKAAPKRMEKAAATALICAHQNWNPEKPLVRIGALVISYAEFVQQQSTRGEATSTPSSQATDGGPTAMLRGVESGVVGERGDLVVSHRTIDLY